MLSEVIGIPATLEQLAEECNELGHAALKLARHLRNENPVHQPITLAKLTKDEYIKTLYSNLAEECADVLVMIDEVAESGLISHEAIDSEMIRKFDRMTKRLNNVLKTDDAKDSKKDFRVDDLFKYFDIVFTRDFGNDFEVIFKSKNSGDKFSISSPYDFKREEISVDNNLSLLFCDRKKVLEEVLESFSKKCKHRTGDFYDFVAKACF